MTARVGTTAAPARRRVGLPILLDGSHRLPLLLRLPTNDAEAPEGACNNGCVECLTQPLSGAGARFTAEVRGLHVVIRHREPTLRRDLGRRIAELNARGAASITLLTNGRLLSYRSLSQSLIRAGTRRFVVKLFALEAASHDAHARADGAFAQALEGIRTLRELGAEVLVTFPLEIAADADRERMREARVALARALTGADPVEMPEPEVESHPNEYRYDVVVLRPGVRTAYWLEDNFFPMAHVNTGPFCNIRCTYCNVHGGDDQRLYARDYVERIIDDAAEQLVSKPGVPGTPTVDFIGGEPTAHPDLPQLILHARSRGFSKVYICTNGVLLLRPGYLDRLIDAGLTGARFSFHDHRPEVANRLADVTGLGARYVEVAKLLLSRRGFHTHLYRIVLAPTLDALPEYLQFLHDHNHSGHPIDLTFGMPSMRGRLFENPDLYPPLDGLREKLARAMEIARSLGIEPAIHHAPGCLLPEQADRVACLHVDTMQFDAMSGRQEVMNFEGDARYGRACDGCAGRVGGCHGLPSAYFASDPDAAEAWLRPIRYRAVD